MDVFLWARSPCRAHPKYRRSNGLKRARPTGVPRSRETPTPLGPPQVPRHTATEGSSGGGVFLSEVPLQTWSWPGAVPTRPPFWNGRRVGLGKLLNPQPSTQDDPVARGPYPSIRETPVHVVAGFCECDRNHAATADLVRLQLYVPK